MTVNSAGLLQKALRLRWELGVENQPMAGILRAANAAMGIQPTGTLVEQADSLLEIMGIPLTDLSIPAPKAPIPAPSPASVPAAATPAAGAADASKPSKPPEPEVPLHMRPPPPRPAYSTMAKAPAVAAARRPMQPAPAPAPRTSDNDDTAEAAEELLERLERRATGGVVSQEDLDCLSNLD